MADHRSALDDFRAVRRRARSRRGRTLPWAARLEPRFVDGDAQGAWGVVEAAMTSGADVRSVYLDMIAPSMVDIGARWAAGEFDVAIEHQATVIVMRIIGRLGSRCVRRGRSRGALLIGAPIGEYHTLPTAMLGDLMRLHGWDVTDLGANTPSASFLHAAKRTPDLVAVGFSVTHIDHLAAVHECCSVFRQELPDVPVGARRPGDPQRGACPSPRWRRARVECRSAARVARAAAARCEPEVT